MTAYRFDKMDELTVVIRGYGTDHNLLVKAKWVLVSESGRQIVSVHQHLIFAHLSLLE